MVQQRYISLTFFKTGKVYLGFGDEATMPGDAVVELNGLPVPLIPRENGATCLSLGPPFVVGIMNGENRNTDGKTMFTTD